MNIKTFFLDKLLTIDFNVGIDLNKEKGFFNKILSLSISRLESMVNIIEKNDFFFVYLNRFQRRNQG